MLMSYLVSIAYGAYNIMLLRIAERVTDYCTMQQVCVRSVFIHASYLGLQRKTLTGTL